ncbi:hypothetical protein [Nocardia suismassiliense]|uniref:hypothetical protein n=1 Tax=Nocardia suismassiliense TaxID=2077092 RepID=UPI000D1DE8C5|nr:hypothetical protein [Nocardia suismassiliense]
MGKHRAPRKPDVPMRLAMVSTAALLTALISADRDGPAGVGPTANRDISTPGQSSSTFAAPPTDQPDIAPDSIVDEPLPESAPRPKPRIATRTPPRSAPPLDDSEPHDLATVTAAWVSGTLQGYEWLAHIEQCILAHMKSTMAQRNV